VRLLVLGRKAGESVVIADEIVITILAVERDQVKLGIEAPRHIPVVRQELFEAVREQNIIAESLAAETKLSKLESLRTFLVEHASDDTGEDDENINKK
jgi:carbon storage regulator